MMQAVDYVNYKIEAQVELELNHVKSKTDPSLIAFRFQLPRLKVDRILLQMNDSFQSTILVENRELRLYQWTLFQSTVLLEIGWIA
jgi:hypothetical protein